jgi:adenylosuccinate synthase
VGLQVIAGGQFGSEAKGAVTARVAAEEVKNEQKVTVVRVGGPNAGHSAADPSGRIWALRQVPAGMVVDPSVRGVIASGSEIDPEVLDHEVQMLGEAGIDVTGRLVISDAATVITPEHKEREAALVGAIGSTGKGIGAARADRIMRQAQTVKDIGVALRLGNGVLLDHAACLERRLNKDVRSASATVILEGTQGYGLGLHTKFYPTVTSGNCRAIDICAQAGVIPWGAHGITVHVVVRPYPIRVAGPSGPLMGETQWEDLGLPVELTTVTKKPRRVGAYDADLVDEAIAANAPFVRLAVSMVDQIPGCVDAGGLTDKGDEFLREMANRHGVPVGWVGIGPRLGDWFRWS